MRLTPKKLHSIVPQNIGYIALSGYIHSAKFAQIINLHHNFRHTRRMKMNADLNAEDYLIRGIVMMFSVVVLITATVICAFIS